MNNIYLWYKKANVYLSLFLFTFILSACGGDGGVDSPSNNNYSISLSTQQVDFHIERGGSNNTLSKVVNVEYQGDGLVIGYLAGIEAPDWLSVSIVKSTSPAQVQLDIIDPLYNEYPLGVSDIELRFITGSIDGKNQVSKDLTLYLNVSDAIKVDKDELSFLYEADSYSPKTLTVSASNPAYGNNNFTWKISSLDERIVISNSDVQVGKGTVEVTLDISEYITNQSITSEVTLENLDSGSQINIPVSIDIIGTRVFAPNNGVFLTSNNNLSIAEEAIKIVSNSNNGVNWTASTDNDWLNISTFGSTEDLLNISLNNNAEQLEKGVIHFASIKLFNENNLNTEGDIITVGYFASEEEVNIVEFELRHFYKHDPIRPYIYQIDYDELNTYITVINILTGIEVSSIEVATVDVNYLISELAVSADGHELFYYTEVAVPSDDLEDPNSATLHALNLTNYSIRDLSGLPEYRNTGDNGLPLTFGRGLYRNILITDSGRIIDAQSGETLISRNESGPYPGDGQFSISANGRYIFDNTTRYTLTDNIITDQLSLNAMLYPSGYDYSTNTTSNFNGSQLKSGGGLEYFYNDDITFELSEFKCHRYINAKDDVIAIKEISNYVLEVLKIGSDGIATDSYQYNREYPGGSWVGTYSSNTCTIQ